MSIVGRDDGVGEEKKCGARVGNCSVRAGDDGLAADGVSSSGELPETVGRVDIDVGDGASVLGRINIAKVVRASGTLLQIDSEELTGKRALDSVEERLLRSGLYRVDGGKGEAEETVAIRVGNKRARDGRCGLDSLRSRSHFANSHLVGVNDTTSAGSIAIRDVPGLA